MNEEDKKIIDKYLSLKINNRIRVRKYAKTEKGKLKRMSYYYRKNNIYHPLYYKEGTKISKFEKDGTPIISKSGLNRSVKKYYYKVLKNIYHPIYNPECKNEGRKYKIIKFKNKNDMC